jgi:hypothetical protein
LKDAANGALDFPKSNGHSHGGRFSTDNVQWNVNTEGRLFAFLFEIDRLFLLLFNELYRWGRVVSMD